MDFENESEILKALGHPVRLKIVTNLISADDCNVNKMVKELDLPQSTVSQHLGILKGRGIITPKKYGVKTCYWVNNPKVRKIIEILNE